MELGLSLGDASEFLENKQQKKKKNDLTNGGLDFCMALGLGSYGVGNQGREKLTQKSQEHGVDDDEDEDDDDRSDDDDNHEEISPVQLNLLPFGPVNPHRINSSLPWSSDNGSSENGSSGNTAAAAAAKVFRPPCTAAEEVSSANSVGSNFTMYRNISTVNGNSLCGNKRDFEAAGNDVVEAERASSRASDDDENAVNTRKKLRLSKEQSAFLEESFKEHNTLNPKQKLALAKQLNLRPRQVEVWFQNRRARTKLKQTEVDCEYLKRCCETLTGENRRLQKELHELRALKASNPFYMQHPATTLTMCPSCERVAGGGAPPSAAGKSGGGVENINHQKGVPLPLSRPRFYPFSQTPTHQHQSAIN